MENRSQLHTWESRYHVDIDKRSKNDSKVKEIMLYKLEAHNKNQIIVKSYLSFRKQMSQTFIMCEQKKIDVSKYEYNQRNHK
jgi:hypothetical protein